MLFIFDMGGVVTNTAKIEENLCRVLNITLEEYNNYCGKNKPYKKDLLLQLSDGDITAKEFWKEFSYNSGKDINCDWFHVLFHPQLNEKTAQLIQQLKAKGHRVICGTNTIDSHYHNHLERGDYTLFDQTYCSCFMGVSKPEEDFYKIIMTAENALPEECVFIDDREDNVKAAANLGIKSILFKDAENLLEELKSYI